MKKVISFFRNFLNLFRFRNGRGEPIVFLRGSEEELRNVTKWICFIYPSLFQHEAIIPTDSHVIIIYSATKHGKPGRSFVGFPHETQIEIDYLSAACDLAFRYNEFTGTLWQVMGERRIGRPTEIRAKLDVRIILPSGQKCPPEEEQMEARRLLAAWLEGKISEEEKTQLFPMLS